MFATTVAFELPASERWNAPIFSGAIALGLCGLCASWWREHWPRKVRDPPYIERMLRHR